VTAPAAPARRPDFIIGGAPRAGTNFLCAALDRHPRVFIPKPFMPEPKVFLMPLAAGETYAGRYATLFARAPEGRVLGEKTANYLEDPEACERLHAHLPEVRLIFLLREPVSRAYSNWLWSTKNGLETLPFEEAIRLEGTRPDPLLHRPWARPFCYLGRSRYDLLARPWLEAFGRERVAFYLYERLVTDPEPVLQAVQVFIGVPPRPLGAADLGVINPARDAGPPIAPATERALRERLAPSVAAFRALTGLDVGPWGYPA
jgi:hypothetical protein